MFCVLNWGLGHATRSTPLIASMIKAGHDVHIASDGLALEVLSRTFPDSTTHVLPAYNVQYASHRFLGGTLLAQSVKMLKAIIKEHKTVQFLQKTHGYDEVISDNRLGCWSRCNHSTYITHQLQIKGGLGGILATQVHRFFIQQYNELWIPDDESIRLSGELSQWKRNPMPTTWLGILSRLPKVTSKTEKTYDAAIVLSGPEPQRTILETTLLNQLTPIYDSIVLVQGCPNKPIETSAHVEVVPLADAHELAVILSQSKRLYCRSGYSTIMDIHPFDLDVTLIPTPGQTEQVYLANYHAKMRGYKQMEQP